MLHWHRTLSWAKIIRRVSLLRVAVLQHIELQGVALMIRPNFLAPIGPDTKDRYVASRDLGSVSGPVRGKGTSALSFRSTSRARQACVVP
jgi:hypothetical protein